MLHYWHFTPANIDFSIILKLKDIYFTSFTQFLASL